MSDESKNIEPQPFHEALGVLVRHWSAQLQAMESQVVAIAEAPGQTGKDRASMARVAETLMDARLRLERVAERVAMRAGKLDGSPLRPV